MTREPGPPDDALPDDPQVIRIAVDVSGLPAVMALARAARDVIDHAAALGRDDFDSVVPGADLRALADAAEPIYPGALR